MASCIITLIAGAYIYILTIKKIKITFPMLIANGVLYILFVTIVLGGI
jgi:hypothetical protein